MSSRADATSFGQIRPRLLAFGCLVATGLLAVPHRDAPRLPRTPWPTFEEVMARGSQRPTVLLTGRRFKQQAVLENGDLLISEDSTLARTSPTGELKWRRETDPFDLASITPFGDGALLLSYSFVNLLGLAIHAGELHAVLQVADGAHDELFLPGTYAARIDGHGLVNPTLLRRELPGDDWRSHDSDSVAFLEDGGVVVTSNCDRSERERCTLHYHPTW